MSETSDPDYLMQLHHHDDMSSSSNNEPEVDEAGASYSSAANNPLIVDCLHCPAIFCTMPPWSGPFSSDRQFPTPTSRHVTFCDLMKLTKNVRTNHWHEYDFSPTTMPGTWKKKVS